MIGDIIEIEENGENKKYNVLFKFDEMDMNAHYVVYTDYSVNNQGNIDVKARQYELDENNQIKLTFVEQQDVKDFIETKLDEILKSCWNFGDGAKYFWAEKLEKWGQTQIP